VKRTFENNLLALALITVCQSGMTEDTEGETSWPLCPSSLDIPARPEITEVLEPEDIHISADEADLEEEGISVLEGNIEITRGTQQLRADTATYDQTGGTAEAEGNIEYWDEEIYVHSEKAHVDLNKRIGRFENSEYRVKSNRARGQAGEAMHDASGTGITHFENADYSTCDPDDNFWKFSAGEITLDHQEERGTAKNVVLRIKGVPVFYTPYASFPLSDKRKTGFLFPNIGSSKRSGTDIRIPFYWNIAPDMDATLTPRILADRGLMLMGQYRYIFSRGSGELNGEFLPSDDDFDDEDRHLLGFKHQQSFADRGKLFITYNNVSDKQYFEDFGSSISQTSTRFLERRADVSYSGNWWDVNARVQNFQTVDRTLPASDRPYERLPQISFNTRFPERNRQLNYQFNSEYVYYSRDDISKSEDVNGSRFDIFPSISYPIFTASSFIKPRVGLRYTQYSLDDTGTFKTSPSRVLPELSLDSGLFLERDTNLFGSQYLQTLEPRLFYLYIPEENQDDLPVFDTSNYDFSFNQLFRGDRFNGPDRMGDSNQFTLAVTSRLINHRTGKESVYASFGQIYYLEDREVTLPGGSLQDESTSPLVAEIGTTIINDLRLRGSLQWNPDNNETEKMVASVQYKPAPQKVVNLSYRVRRVSGNSSSTGSGTDIEQSDITFAWPINQNWGVVGRWNYAVPERRSLDTFGGIEYESCCWGVRAVARRFLTDIDGDYENGVFLQFELKGLAGVGQKTVEFFKEKIPGYQSGF